MKWLVTAFAPFGGARTNSSQIILEKLRTQDWGDRVRFHSPVPVEFRTAWPDVRRHLSPDIGGLLALGQAENRSRIGLERVALNWTDARIPDNSGFVPEQNPIMAGPNMHWCNIPWENYPLSEDSERSYSAGTYVCNSLMYQSLDWGLASQKSAGFVHLPVLSSQDELALAKSPKLDEAKALKEMNRIMEFLLKL